MARVRFTEDFSYKPVRRITIDYKAGQEVSVKRDCADAAIAAGKAIEIKARARSEAEDDGKPMD